jgi:hypothetical protein
MRVRAPEKLILQLAIGVVLAALFGLIVESNLNEEFHRASGIGVRAEMRDIAVALYEKGSASEGSALGREPYWGPLTPELLQSAAISPDRAVDPFNRSIPKAQWRTFPDAVSDSFAWDRLRGGPLWFFCNGDGFWMIIGRGPDGVLNLSQPILDSIATHWKRENGTHSFDAALLSPYTYDPSNGTISAGDIWRIPELE